MAKGWLLIAALFASVAHADLSLSQSFINFFNTPVGGADSATVYVRNMGNAVVQLHESDSCYLNFQVENYCNLSLPPNQSCSLRVQFQPRNTGSWNCAISLGTSEGRTYTIQIVGQSRR